jgi:hypothetical protein
MSACSFGFPHVNDVLERNVDGSSFDNWLYVFSSCGIDINVE